MTISIRRLEEADIPYAARAIQRTFFPSAVFNDPKAPESKGDPYANWLYDFQPGLLVRNLESLSIRLRWLIDYGCPLVAEEDGKVVGVALWMAPVPKNQSYSDRFWAYTSLWKVWFQQVWMNMRFGYAGLNVHRYNIWKKVQQETHDEVLANDDKGVWFLNIVVVDPAEQGKGIGKKLVTYVLDIADKSGIRCYLESSKWDPNVTIYRKMGFEVAKEMVCDDNGEICKLYSMVREVHKA
ncbi:hypothetical protein CANCADRAFT_107151 [Tortispora caseinolytica NRRL Y-17796]|uniref:N-acetyltransferase domain-containing protein n=1 Tax=Tortispora caseinolytica NRRL Y-17796 TaxID=767744 RepID=A0A1E4TFN5_9ASCO|nr:hypothetical protein CANCADRAFT_107151 [Tortispora caseinolytica NRRL Y-17796]